MSSGDGFKMRDGEVRDTERREKFGGREGDGQFWAKEV